MPDYEKSTADGSNPDVHKNATALAVDASLEDVRTPHDAVISSHDRDIEIVERVAGLLHRLGIAAISAEELRPTHEIDSTPRPETGTASSVVLVIGPHGTSDAQVEVHKPLLAELAQSAACRTVALLLADTAESALPEWFDFNNVVRFDPKGSGLAAVSDLYRAIQGTDSSAEGPNPEPELTRTVEQSNVKQRIERFANFLGRDRKVRAISERVSYLRDNPDEVHRLIPSANQEEELIDWCSAETYFASDVLRGRVDMTRQFSPHYYVYLEKVWLDQAKQLRAYLIWSSGRITKTEDSAARHYMRACRELNETFHSEPIKAGLAEYLPFADYLQDRYLHHGKLDPNKLAAHALIQSKAWCIWKCLGQPDNRHTQNWRDAEAYVRSFYENIGPAIEEKKPRAVKGLLAAMKMGDSAGYRYHIMDCFEAALLVYFVDPKLVDKCCGPDEFAL